MNFRTLIVVVAVLLLAAVARAGFVAAIPESMTVMLVFVALATIGFAAVPKRAKVES